MSGIEILIYAVLAGVVFLTGAGLIIRQVARSSGARRLAAIAFLLGWIVLPLLLAMFALAAMMSPTGGDPVILILRLIAVGYIVGGGVVALVLAELAAGPS